MASPVDPAEMRFFATASREDIAVRFGGNYQPPANFLVPERSAVFQWARGLSPDHFARVFFVSAAAEAGSEGDEPGGADEAGDDDGAGDREREPQAMRVVPRGVLDERLDALRSHIDRLVLSVPFAPDPSITLVAKQARPPLATVYPPRDDRRQPRRAHKPLSRSAERTKTGTRPKNVYKNG